MEEAEGSGREGRKGGSDLTSSATAVIKVAMKYHDVLDVPSL